MKRFLEKYLKIYVHEYSAFVWMGFIFFTIFFVTAIFRNYVDAAFLAHVGPQWIPWMLVINALLTFIVLGVIDRLSTRFKDHLLLAGFLAFYAVSATVLYFLVRERILAAYAVLYQMLYLLDSILLVYLWNMAGDLFDARQGKRIFPLITASQVLGTTIGSFSTKPLTLLIGQDPTLLIFATVCLGMGVYMGATGNRLLGGVKPSGAGAKPGAASKRLSEIPGLIKEYPIVRYLIVTGLVPNVLLPIFFYQFSTIAKATFPTEEGLISFLSLFRGCTTFATFLFLFFMGRMYSRIGLTNSSLVHPVNFAFIFSGLAAFWNIYIAAYGQFSVILIQRAIAGPVNKILYSIVPRDLMAWSRSFIRGTVLKVGMLTGALLMIALKPVMQPRDFAYIAIGFSIWWVIETLIFRSHYKRILKQVIVEKQIDFDQIESVRTFDSGGAAMELGPVSVEERSEDEGITDYQHVPELDPEVALKLLEDPNPGTRAHAAASFIASKDIRCVRKLLRCLGETDDRVRNAAIEALISFREQILPFLEVSLTDPNPRIRQGILEVIRLSKLKDFDMVPFLGSELMRAYRNLLVIRSLSAMDHSRSVELLRKNLEELNEEILRQIFYALWVNHADMRLMYQALKSETASIAVEMVENSIQREITPYLIPLIEDVPLDEKIEKGRSMLPLPRSNELPRLLSILVETEDKVTRLLTLYVIGEEMRDPCYVPVVQSHLDDEDPFVREIAEYAMTRSLDGEAPMPEIIERIEHLKNFTIFEGMGVRELHAIASVLRRDVFAPGEVMIREGEDNSSIYLLVKGKVTVYEGYGTPEQKEKVTLGEGSFLGELSMFTLMPPNATCIVAEETEAYVLLHHQFMEIMRVYPQIGINLCRFFSVKCRLATY